MRARTASAVWGARCGQFARRVLRGGCGTSATVAAALVAWAVASGLAVLVSEPAPLPSAARPVLEPADQPQAHLLASWSGAGACPAPGPVSRDPGRGTQPGLDPSSLPALQPPGREVLSRWARLSQPFPVRVLWLDGRGEHSGRPEPETEVGPELPVSHRAREAGSRNESSPKGGRSCGGQRQDNDGCPRGLRPLLGAGRRRPVVGLVAGPACVRKRLAGRGAGLPVARRPHSGVMGSAPAR